MNHMSLLLLSLEAGKPIDLLSLKSEAEAERNLGTM